MLEDDNGDFVVQGVGTERPLPEGENRVRIRALLLELAAQFAGQRREVA